MQETIWTPDNSWLLQYRAKAEAGEIIIGQDMWMELDNLAEDIKSGEYRYETSDAKLRINFIENCVKLTKSPFYGQPMILLLWQKAFIEAVYSFKMQVPGIQVWVDRFQEILLKIARKNGKSETVAAIQLAELVVGKSGSDIVCSGMDDGTADLSYQAIDTMRLLIDPKSRDTWRNQKGIKCQENASHIYKLSASTRQREGRNIDIAGIDEVWSLPADGDIYKSIQQSTSTKDNFKIFMFGSEGFVQDGFLDKKTREYTAIIRGEDDTDAAKRKLPWLYTQDSEQEIWNTDMDGISKLWLKSNPSLGSIKKWSYLKDRVEEARKSKTDRIYVLSKDFNIKQNAATSWLNLEDYAYECDFDIKDFKGALALGAVDLAETTDLCAAKALMIRPGDPNKYILSHYFIPASKLEDADDKLAGAQYVEWKNKGLLTITEGNDIDLAVVADWFYSLHTLYGIRLWKCGYDQKFAKDWITRMEYYGWTKGGKDDSDLIMIIQDARTLSNAIKLCEADFKHQLIRYRNHEIDRWCYGNAGVKVDGQNFALIVKMETKKRIDGAVCLAIVYEMWRRYRTEFKAMVENK